MITTFLELGGYYCFAFALFHILFWKIFRWRQDLQQLTPINRGVMQILNLRLIYVLLFFGFISIRFQHELLFTSFGEFIVITIALFWFLRAVEQVLFFGLKNAASITLFIVFLIGGTFYTMTLF
jgi:uncharacterized protein